MINKVLIDENKQYRFDFSKVEAVWEIHEISNKISLSDADFRRRIKFNLMNILPFKLENNDDTIKFISSLEVYDLEEFKNNITDIVITPVVEQGT